MALVENASFNQSDVQTGYYKFNSHERPRLLLLPGQGDRTYKLLKSLSVLVNEEVVDYDAKYVDYTECKDSNGNESLCFSALQILYLTRAASEKLADQGKSCDEDRYIGEWIVGGAYTSAPDQESLELLREDAEARQQLDGGSAISHLPFAHPYFFIG